MTTAGKAFAVAVVVAVVGGVAAFAFVLAPPRRRPRAARTDAPPPREAPATPAAAPGERVEPPAPVVPAAATVPVEARRASGEALDAVTVFEDDVRSEEVATTPGSRIARAHVGRWASAPRAAWTRVPEPGADGVCRIVLREPGPPVRVYVTEPDGSPAAQVPVAYGPPRTPRETDGEGLLDVADAPPGVLRIRVGGAERSAPPVRVVVGRDTAVRVALDPPLVVAGRALEVNGPEARPVRLGAFTVRGWSPDGPGRPAAIGREGDFTWRGRASERVTLELDPDPQGDLGARSGFEVPWPDPRGPLLVRMDLRAARAGARVLVDRAASARPSGRVDVVGEPAVLSVVREVLGPGAAADAFTRRLRAGGGWREPWSGPPRFDGAEPEVPMRVSARGDVVPEDHVVDVPAVRDRLDATVRVTLAADAPEAAGAVAAAHDPRATGTLRGKVVDASGKPLRGVTVGAGGERAVSAADGTFAVERVVPGEATQVVYGWLDGADPGEAAPMDYAPFRSATIRPSSEPVTLVLPRAGTLTFRLVDGIDDRPLSWAHVVLADAAGEVRFDDVVATREGRAALRDLGPLVGGTLTVLAPGYRRSVSVALPAGVATDLGDVRLSRGGTVAGVVRDRKGDPVAAATVAMLDDGWLVQGGTEAAKRADVFLRRVETDAKGAFRLSGLDTSRPVPVAAWAPGFAPQVRRVTWTKPDAADLSVTLSRGGSFRVIVSDPSRRPVSGAVLDVEDARTGARWLSLVERAVLGGYVGSSEDLRRASAMLLQEDRGKPGTYRLGPVEPGPYELRVVRPGYEPYRAQLTVPDDEPDDPGALGSRVRFGSLDLDVELKPAAVGDR